MGKESGFCWARGCAGGGEGAPAIVCPAAARLGPPGVGAPGAGGEAGEGRASGSGRGGPGWGWRRGGPRGRGRGGPGGSGGAEEGQPGAGEEGQGRTGPGWGQPGRGVKAKGVTVGEGVDEKATRACKLIVLSALSAPGPEIGGRWTYTEAGTLGRRPLALRGSYTRRGPRALWETHNSSK